MRRIALASLVALALPAAAGNMMVTLDGLSPIALSGFSTGASNAVSLSGGGTGVGKVTYKDFTFRAPQSISTPQLMLRVSDGRHLKTVTVQVRTPDGSKLSTEWILSDGLVTSVDVTNGPVDPKAKSPDFFLAPETSFTVIFDKYCYRVYAPDGTTIASQMCWDISANKGA